MKNVMDQGIKRGRYGLMAVTLVLTMAILPSVLGSSHTETVVGFDASAGQLPEGVTVDDAGNVFVSLTPLGQLVKVESGSDVAESFASIEGLMEGDIGLLGLAVDASGNVYGGVGSANEDVNGVWRFDTETGEAERIEGSEAITFPNSVAFDEDGTMYITDTIVGAVWRVEEDGAAEMWIQDALLEGDGSAGFPFPIGANGVAVSEDTVYVGVSEAGTIVAIPVLSDGSADSASVWAEMPEGAVPDGIALDVDGNIYVASPISNAVLRVNVDGSVDTIATEDDGLDAPTSVACGIAFDECQNIYVVNFSVAIAPPGGAGPALLKINAGE